MLRMKSGKSPKGPVNLTPEQEALRKRLRRDLKEIMGKIHSDARLSDGELDRLGETAATNNLDSIGTRRSSDNRPNRASISSNVAGWTPDGKQPDSSKGGADKASCHLIDRRAISRRRDWLPLRLGDLQPRCFGQEDLRQRLLGRLPEGGAMDKVGDIGDVPAVLIAMK